jgi:hypothetical protein
MTVNLHKNAPFDDLHISKLRTGTRPAAPEGLGDAHWNPTTSVLSLADDDASDWVEYLLPLASAPVGQDVSRVSRSTNQTIEHSGISSVTAQWDNEEIDELGGFDLVADNTLFTVPTSGRYTLSFQVRLTHTASSNNGHPCRVRLRVDGTTRLEAVGKFSNDYEVPAVGHITLDLTAGQTLSLNCKHDEGTGTGTAILGDAAGSTSFWQVVRG